MSRATIRILAAVMCLLAFSLAGKALAGKKPVQSFPEVAMDMAADLDRQMAPRLGIGGPRNSRGLYWVAVTVPASLDNLEMSSPLGRLMGQELASAFVAKGYNVQELRKTREIVFSPQGEFMLSRDVNALATKRVLTTLVVAGTYTPTAVGVRFNVEVINAANNNVVAMSSRTLPYSPSVGMLLGSAGGVFSQPTVATTNYAAFEKSMIPYSR